MGQGVENMEKWELIADITIENTAENISITEDMSGNPFQLKAVEIFIISMPTEYSSACEISAGMTKTRDNPTKIGHAAMNSDTKRYCYGLWEKTGFGIIHKKSLWSVSGVTNITGMTFSVMATQSFSDDGPACPEVCEGIWIGSHYQEVLSPGTKIKILGIRE